MTLTNVATQAGSVGGKSSETEGSGCSTAARSALHVTLGRGQSPCTDHLSQRFQMIHVENLSKSFFDLRRGDVLALDHVSFDVAPGEIFGLLGPNGAGKTTCLRMLSTVLKPTGGRAEIAGFDVATQPEQVRSHIGFMSNNTKLRGENDGPKPV